MENGERARLKGKNRSTGTLEKVEKGKVKRRREARVGQKRRGERNKWDI